MEKLLKESGSKEKSKKSKKRKKSESEDSELEYEKKKKKKKVNIFMQLYLLFKNMNFLVSTRHCIQENYSFSSNYRLFLTLKHF